MYTISSIGQDSHRFCSGDEGGSAHKPLVLGGVVFDGCPPLMGNSDADVVLHALCNAVSGITGVNIIGAVADQMCFAEGVTNSAEYVKKAMESLGGRKIIHVSFTLECARPTISPRIEEMRERIAKHIGISERNVCITATSGEGLTDFGRGLGIQAYCVLTAMCV